MIMFKIGQRYTYKEDKCTVYLVSKDKNKAVVKFDNPLLGHSGVTSDIDYYHNDNGDKVIFINKSFTGFYFIWAGMLDLVLINESIDYEIY